MSPNSLDSFHLTPLMMMIYESIVYIQCFSWRLNEPLLQSVAIGQAIVGIAEGHRLEQIHLAFMDSNEEMRVMFLVRDQEDIKDFQLLPRKAKNILLAWSIVAYPQFPKIPSDSCDLVGKYGGEALVQSQKLSNEKEIAQGRKREKRCSRKANKEL